MDYVTCAYCGNRHEAVYNYTDYGMEPEWYETTIWDVICTRDNRLDQYNGVEVDHMRVIDPHTTKFPRKRRNAPIPT